MPQYLHLFKFTDAGRKTMKQSPDRIAAIAEAVQKLGGKMTFLYLMGEFDSMAIGEFPNDETAAKAVAMIASAGYVGSTTMRAFTPDEFKSIVADLPG